MKLREDNGGYVIQNKDKDLLCPFSELVLKTQVQMPEQSIVGQQVAPVQVTTKTHRPCGSWCALFEFSSNYITLNCGGTRKIRREDV